MHRQSVMTQRTIRWLDRTVIDSLKQRAAAAGRSIEEEARRSLSEPVLEEQLARQRARVASRRNLHKQLDGDEASPDPRLFREMRDERMRQIEAGALRKTEALR